MVGVSSLVISLPVEVANSRERLPRRSTSSAPMGGGVRRPSPSPYRPGQMTTRHLLARSGGDSPLRLSSDSCRFRFDLASLVAAELGLATCAGHVVGPLLANPTGEFRGDRAHSAREAGDLQRIRPGVRHIRAELATHADRSRRNSPGQPGSDNSSAFGHHAAHHPINVSFCQLRCICFVRYFQITIQYETNSGR